jgi:hypothetical protein
MFSCSALMTSLLKAEITSKLSLTMWRLKIVVINIFYLDFTISLKFREYSLNNLLLWF